MLFLPPANEVWGKVIFLHLSVILFTGGGGSTWAGTPQQVPPLAGTPARAGTPWQVHPPGRYTPRQVHPPGRYTPQQSMLGYGQQADGTHPTGMHSCLCQNVFILSCRTWNILWQRWYIWSPRGSWQCDSGFQTDALSRRRCRQRNKSKDHCAHRIPRIGAFPRKVSTK